ncbi:MAG: tetratricopeptide repeat protein [Candidatus Melainabacteria bacterium]|nr:tetratricopeptide repeat protein [Candidatus Melainabacteria bacterium]
MKKHHVVNALAALLIAALPALSAPANLYAQAVADYNAGKYGQAATAFETIKAQYPNNALTHYYLALCRQALGHFDKARQEYEWVSQHGDASLKGLAAQGMSRMSGVKTSASGSGSATHTASATQSPAGRPPAGAKVKKILEFYADW